MQFHTWHVRIFLLAFSTDPHVARSNTFYGAIIVEKHFCCRETWIHFNAHIFGLLGQPSANVTHGNDIVAIIVDWRRQKQIRDLKGRFTRGVVVENVLFDFRRQGRAHRLPIWEQFIER